MTINNVHREQASRAIQSVVAFCLQIVSSDSAII